MKRYAKLGLERRLFLFSKEAACSGKKLRRWNVPQRYALVVETTPPPCAELLPYLAFPRGRSAGISSAGTAPRQGSRRARRPAPLRHASRPRRGKPPHWRQLMEMLDDRGISWIVVGRGEALDGIPPPVTSPGGRLRETCAAAGLFRTDHRRFGPMHPLPEPWGRPRSPVRSHYGGMGILPRRSPGSGFGGSAGVPSVYAARQKALRPQPRLYVRSRPNG